jgi:predicted acyl esterase
LQLASCHLQPPHANNKVENLHIHASSADLQLFVYTENVAPDGPVYFVTEGLFRAIRRQISNEEPPAKSVEKLGSTRIEYV